MKVDLKDKLIATFEKFESSVLPYGYAVLAEHYDKLAEKLIEDRWNMFPCNIGDILYVITEHNKIFDYTVEEFVIDKFSTHIVLRSNDFNKRMGVSFNSIGEIAFFTHKEAENKLKEK